MINGKEKLYNYFIVSIDSKNESVYCYANNQIINIGSIIEMQKPGSDKTFVGKIIDGEYRVKENELPMPIENMYQYLSKVEYEKTKSKRDEKSVINEESEHFRAFLLKLEEYYPEHKVFALDSIDRHMREKLSYFYKTLGYATEDDFLQKYGFGSISGEEVKEIRNKVIYTPGNEPDIIKNKVENMVSKLKEYYPDGVIFGSIQSEHKRIAQTVSGLYQWLGYETSSDMLKAYGFECVNIKMGRKPENAHIEVIELLKNKYKDKEKPKNMGLLIFENPELAGKIKTIQNKSNELFGMSLNKYFVQEGIFAKKEEPVIKEPVVRIKKYKYLEVKIDGVDEPVFCSYKNTSNVIESQIEMLAPGAKDTVWGYVEKMYSDIVEEDLPMPIDEMFKFVRKITKKELMEIEDAKVKYIYCSVSMDGRGDTLYYISPFEDIEVGDIVEVHHAWHGIVKGVVKRIDHYSKNTAPYPVGRTKKIERIIINKQKYKMKIEQDTKNFIEKHEIVDFVKKPVSEKVLELHKTATYFCNAVFRGLELDVFNAVITMYPDDIEIDKRIIGLGNGIAQFECENKFVYEIMEKFPNLKGLFFLEKWKDKKVYLGYSESGYTTTTHTHFLENCNFYEADRWALVHDPTKFAGKVSGNWKALDYVLPGGDKKLFSDIIIPSRVTERDFFEEPCEIINICFPEK